MRTLFYNIFFFIVIVLFITCKYKVAKNDSDLQEMESSGVDTIYIDLEAIPTNLSFKDFFIKIEIVQLPFVENYFFDLKQEMIINEHDVNNYVLLNTSKLNDSFFCFDSAGRFIQKVPLNLFEGKKDLLIPDVWHFRPRDFKFNQFDSLYVLYDGMEFFMYDKIRLKCISKTKLDFVEDLNNYIDYFIPINKNIYVFSGIVNKSWKQWGEWGDVICFYSISGDSIIKKELIPQKFYVIRTKDSPYFTFKNRFFYQSQIISNTVYEIHPDSFSVTPFLVIDYGKKTVTEENIYDFFTEMTSDIKSKSEHYAYLHNVRQNNKSYWLFSCLNGKIYVSVYNKATKEIQTVSDGNFASTIPLLTDEILYCVIDTFQTQKLIDSGILTKENAENLEQIKAGNNPVILKCYLK